MGSEAKDTNGEERKQQQKGVSWWGRWGLTVLLAAGNLLYLCTHGWGPIYYHPQLILMNLVLFLVVGVIVFFAASYYLHQWFVLKKGTAHSQAKEAIKKGLALWELFLNCFRPGNMHILFNLYVCLAIWGTVSYVTPPFLLGMVSALLVEAAAAMRRQHPQAVQQLARWWGGVKEWVLLNMPKYEGSQ